jgi:hypothetical protein
MVFRGRSAAGVGFLPRILLFGPMIPGIALTGRDSR